MKLKDINLEFKFNQLYEFQNAAAMIANKDQYIQIFKEVGEELEYLNIVEEMETHLSRFLSEELIFFFSHPKNQESLGSQVMINKAVMNPFAISIQEGLELLEEMDEVDLVAQMVGPASETPINAVSERLKECLKYPEETKQRYCMMLRRFYEHIYRPFEDQIHSVAEKGVEKYNKLYEQNPKWFVENYFKKTVEELESTTNIHLSLFDQVCSVQYTRVYKEKAHSWMCLGIHIDRFLGSKPQKKQVDQFLKLISDNKRIQIIDFLVERPCYANELSKKLKLTPAAVSYHMAFFYNLDLVKIRRKENRHYYLLDKEKMKNYFVLLQSAIMKS